MSSVEAKLDAVSVPPIDDLDDWDKAGVILFMESQLATLAKAREQFPNFRGCTIKGHFLHMANMVGVEILSRVHTQDPKKRHAQMLTDVFRWAIFACKEIAMEVPVAQLAAQRVTDEQRKDSD